MAHQPDLDDQSRLPLCVLKFGSSVLTRPADYAAAADEIFRHIRAGEKVIAVVSALDGETDALLAEAGLVGGDAPPALVARVARIGELKSAGLMGLALSRVGIRASVADPHELGLEAEGEPLDAVLSGLDEDRVRALLDAHEVLVVPGFTAGHARHGTVTLGRGGTDLTAVFLAGRMKAGRVRLLKDVDGVYTEDPAVNPKADRYAQLGYDEAAAASRGLIQPKAIEMADAWDVPIEIAALGAAEATLIGRCKARRASVRVARPLRVALLGCGSVGTGVLGHLRSRPDLFELGAVLVRNPDKPGRPEGVAYTNQLDQALAGQPDLVIELIGGADHPARLMQNALNAGASVATANKAAIAAHYDALHDAAANGGGGFLYAGAVGGGTPVLETLKRAAPGAVRGIEGVMNGTANFLLDRLAEGWAFETALKRAQELGFAEADPSADVDGHDAADKLSILIREAFGLVRLPRDIAKHSLRQVTPGMAAEARKSGLTLKQLGRCALSDNGELSAEIVIVPVAMDHPLAGARNEENRFCIRYADGHVVNLFGKGAGRWPTASAVFADVMDLQRAFQSNPDGFAFPAGSPVAARMEKARPAARVPA